METTFIDTHAHLNLSAFMDDVDGVVERCREEGVSVFNVGTTLKTSTRAVELAIEYQDLYAIIGLHPINTVPGTHDDEQIGSNGRPVTAPGEAFDTEAFRELAERSSNVIGIGECGFDYFHTPAGSFETQEASFIAQIKLANELQLPLMIHTRNPKPGEASPTGRSVYADVYDVLKQYAKVPFNVHFYAGTYDEAAKFFELGGTISFTGVITFAKDYEAVVRNAPLEKIHAETDCPFVAPVPYRGKRAEPWMVIEVYKKIAAIKGLEEEVVRTQLMENARQQYRIQQ